ncbi:MULTISPECIES: UbiA family prenyltransferase [Catenuloplanes]|uniref:Chlorophyll synthase n=1 Tax=Catenuloplanes niger TaxID=587534 RepID=A0AAE3ZW85_9ACTN|nr:UbiA family prenyltransferase [Catenuloplanes niger]MDR7325268.1 chlorophyll synthase [Catenuloplanes niger]
MLQRSRVRTHRAVVLAAVSRPWFWPVSWVPAYLGLVLAAGELTPRDPWRAGLTLLVLGPLIWGAVLAHNDLHDLPTDRLNPRKTGAGAVPPRHLRAYAVIAALAALATAALIGPLFVLGVAGVLALGWAYSAPPLRLKARAGADVLVNALVVGVVAPLGGWSVGRDPWDFPWQLALLGLLFAAAFYVPTTVVDRPADLRAGYSTIAVRFGAGGAYRLGLSLWALALGLSLACASADVLIPAATLPYQLLLAPVLLGAYAWLTRSPSIPRLAVLALLFALPSAGFALSIT